MAVASVYERMLNYKDAQNIYEKVYTDCPRSTALPWMARIQTGLLANSAAVEKKDLSFFEEVDNADHPFPLPRMIAQYYQGKIDDKELKRQWTMNSNVPRSSTCGLWLRRSTARTAGRAGVSLGFSQATPSFRPCNLLQLLRSELG